MSNQVTQETFFLLLFLMIVLLLDMAELFLLLSLNFSKLQMLEIFVILSI